MNGPPEILRRRSNESHDAALDRLERLSILFDTAFVLPGTKIHFGIESLMRLVPGIGDAAASALSCWILYEARNLDVPKTLFARMVGNVAIEGVVGAIPVLGDLFDISFRANRRNVALLRRHFDRSATYKNVQENRRTGATVG